MFLRDLRLARIPLRQQRPRRAPGPRARLLLEILEDRILPATFGPHVEDFANDTNPSQPGFDFTGAFRHDFFITLTDHVITDPADTSGKGNFGEYEIDTSATASSGFALYLTQTLDLVTFPNLDADQEIHFVRVDVATGYGDIATVTVQGRHGTYTQRVFSHQSETVSVGWEHILPSGLELGPIESVTLTSWNGRLSFSDLTILVEQAGQIEPPPVAVDYTASILSSQTATIDVFANDSDPDGDTIQLVGVGAPGHGTAHMDHSIPGTINYTPDQGFVGTDSFTYTIVDQKGSDATATITVTVSEPIDPPADDVFEVPHGFRGPFQVSAPGVLANDPTMPDSDDTVTPVVVTQGRHGTVALNPTDGSFLYTPDGGPNALVLNDTFTYAFTDGTSTSAPATVHLVPINQRPEAAVDATFPVLHGFRGVFMSVAPGVLENDPTPYDPDGDSVTPVVVQQGQFGTAAINPDGSFSYTPNGGANALIVADTFTYALNDGYTNGPAATIHLVPVNQPPVATGFPLQLRHDQIGQPVILGSLIDHASDPDGDPLQVVSAVSRGQGTIVVDARGNYTYTPPAHTLHDDIDFQVSDGYAPSNLATIDIMWDNNPPPDPADEQYVLSIGSDYTAGILHPDVPLIARPGNPAASLDLFFTTFPITDSDGDPIHVEVVRGPVHGTLDQFYPDSGGFHYTPFGPRQLFTDTFTYVLSDGYVKSRVAKVTIVPERMEPILHTDVFGITRPGTDIIGRHHPLSGQIRSVLENDVFPDGTPLTGRATALVADLGNLSGDARYGRLLSITSGHELHPGDSLEGEGGYTLSFDDGHNNEFANPPDSEYIFSYYVSYSLNDDADPPTALSKQRAEVIFHVYPKPSNATGIPTEVENAGPNNGDGNYDRIPDAQEENVASLPNAVTGSYITMDSPAGTQLYNVQALPAPTNAPADFQFPLGVFDFWVVGFDPTKPLTVTIHLTEPLPAGSKYYKFGPTPDNPQDHWYDFDYDPVTKAGAKLFSDTIVLYFPVSLVQAEHHDPNDRFHDPGGPILLTRPDVVYVTALYRTLLNRPPDPGGFIHWVQLLDDGSSRQQVAQGIYESPEHRGLQVDQFYVTYLHRGPDPTGRTFWTGALLAGLSETDVARGFLTSPEYQAAHPDAASLVTGLYADLWGKPLDAPGQSLIELLPHLPFNRDLIVAGFLNSVQARQRLLDRYYSEFLGRAADAAGEAFWLGILENAQASVDRVAEAFLASEEYFARPTGKPVKA